METGLQDRPSDFTVNYKSSSNRYKKYVAHTCAVFKGLNGKLFLLVKTCHCFSYTLQQKIQQLQCH
jgi:hypothetical protein